MSDVIERGDVAAASDKGWASSVLATLGRLVLAVLVAVLLAFLFLPLISVFISRSPLELVSSLDSNIAYQALILSLETTAV